MLLDLVDSFCDPGLDSSAGDQLQRILISQQIQNVIDEQHTSLVDLRDQGLLVTLAGLVGHKVC